jgi:Icc-related predicted phosphoesterase
LTRILAISDEVDNGLYGDKLYALRPDLLVACGDLPFEYLENLVSRTDVPLVYVPGNHDPDLKSVNWSAPSLVPEPAPGPQGCDNADGRVIQAAGLRVAGLGGSLRYNLGPNQYSQTEMQFRSLSLEMRLRMKQALRGGGLEVLLTHAPPRHCGDEEDPAHQGFDAFHRLVARLAPRLLIHGHIHPVGREQADRRMGSTLIVNAVPYRLLEV